MLSSNRNRNILTKLYRFSKEVCLCVLVLLLCVYISSSSAAVRNKCPNWKNTSTALVNSSFYCSSPHCDINCGTQFPNGCPHVKIENRHSLEIVNNCPRFECTVETHKDSNQVLFFSLMTTLLEFDTWPSDNHVDSTSTDFYNVTRISCVVQHCGHEKYTVEFDILCDKKCLEPIYERTTKPKAATQSHSPTTPPKINNTNNSSVVHIVAGIVAGFIVGIVVTSIVGFICLKLHRIHLLKHYPNSKVAMSPADQTDESVLID